MSCSDIKYADPTMESCTKNGARRGNYPSPSTLRVQLPTVRGVEVELHSPWWGPTTHMYHTHDESIPKATRT